MRDVLLSLLGRQLLISAVLV